jgi:hypothetical protein
MANSNGWGDGAANNSIGWGQGANNAIAWGDSHAKSWAGATDIIGLTTDPAASAFIAATGITGATQQAAIDTLVKGLKADGLWSKMKAVYPFVTDNRNLLGYSEDFGNAYWSKVNTSITANTINSPTGTLTADTLQNLSTGGFGAYLSAAANIASPANTYTQSYYAKKNNNDWVGMYTSDQGSNYAVAWFNVNTGVVGTVSAVGNFTSATSSITNVGSGWYRCSLTFTKPSSASSDSSIIVPNSDNTFNRTSGQNLYLWGAQLELSSTATTYQPIATTQQAYIASQFKYNLVNPVDSDAAFRLVFNGGWTHSSTGATPNGTNGYADTKLVPSSSLSTSSAHLSYYSRTNVNQASYDLSSSQHYSLLLYQNKFYVNLETSGQYNATQVLTNTTGYYIGSRINNTNVNGYRNGIKTINNIAQNSTLSAQPLFLAATNNGQYFSSKQVAFTSIGDGLTDIDATNLYSRVNTFQVALSRNV